VLTSLTLQLHSVTPWSMHLVGNNSSMQPTHISSRCVFINIVFCPCHSFLLWNVVLTCLAFRLITIIDTRFLSFTCMLACLTYSPLHPPLAHHHHDHLCYVDVYWFFLLFLFFLIFAICYISLWLHFGLFMYIFSFVRHSIVYLLNQITWLFWLL